MHRLEEGTLAQAIPKGASPKGHRIVEAAHVIGHQVDLGEARSGRW